MINEYEYEYEDEIYTIEDFHNLIMCGAITDDDGYGEFIKNDKKFGKVLPSNWKECLQKCKSENIFHIVWYNR
jgi:hypothetical protein